MKDEEYYQFTNSCYIKKVSKKTDISTKLKARQKSLELKEKALKAKELRLIEKEKELENLALELKNKESELNTLINNTKLY